MADNNAESPTTPGSPEPDPWATTPRQRLTPPEGQSPFARPAENAWQPPAPPEADAPTEAVEAIENPYDTSGWGAQASSYPPQAPPPPAPPYASAGHPAADQSPAQPTASYPAPGYGASGQPSTGQPWGSTPGSSYPGAAPVAARRDANPLAALFDFSFTRFATPGLVKIVYILQVVAAVGAWVLWLLVAFATSSFGGGAGVAVVVLLFGWIPVLLSIAFTRFVLEGIVALIRIHDRVTEIADRDKGSSS